MSVITLTFAECVENHVGNQQTGRRAERAPSLQDLILTRDAMARWLQSRGAPLPRFELLDLGCLCPEAQVPAGVLVIRGLKAHTPAEGAALAGVAWDDKYLDQRRKAVLNKHARTNLCIADHPQEPAYEEGRGRIYTFAQLPPFVGGLREFFTDTLHVAGVPGRQNPELPPAGLFAEGNNYYDPHKCYIGWHGDTERSLVLGYRVGGPFPLHFKWFSGPGSPAVRDGHLVGTTIELNDGDAYVMSEAAVGKNWRCKGYHLRHAAGEKMRPGADGALPDE